MIFSTPYLHSISIFTPVGKLLDCILISGGEQVRIHDFILDIINKRVTGDRVKDYHAAFLDAYIKKDLKEDCRNWWNVQNDKYIFKNIPRHLVESKNEAELGNLLCDIRWIKKRVEIGGWLPLSDDFRCFDKIATDTSLRNIEPLIRRNWSFITDSTFAFRIFGYLSGTERKEKNAQVFRKRRKFLRETFLKPLNKRLGPRDARDISNWGIPDVYCIDVNWVKRCIAVGSGDPVQIWDIDMNEQLRTLLGHIGRVTSVAISQDGKFIVSGSDNTVRRWDAETGLSIGDPLTRHTSEVSMFVICQDGNFTVPSRKESFDDGTRSLCGAFLVTQAG